MFRKLEFNYNDPLTGEAVRDVLYFKEKTFKEVQLTNIQSSFGAWKVSKYAELIIRNGTIIKNKINIEYFLDSFLTKD